MKEKTTGGVKRRKYDASFKKEVLRMIYNRRPASEVAPHRQKLTERRLPKLQAV